VIMLLGYALAICAITVAIMRTISGWLTKSLFIDALILTVPLVCLAPLVAGPGYGSMLPLAALLFGPFGVLGAVAGLMCNAALGPR